MRRLTIAAVAIIVTAGTIVALGVFGPTRHKDGGGLLASTPGNSTALVMGPDASSPSWTFGITLCLTDPTQPVTLVAVRPKTVSGEGARFLGGLAREVEAGTDTVGSAPAFPPSSVGVVRQVAGTTVANACSDQAHTTEVLLGLALGQGGVGGWRGEEVEYIVNEQSYVLELDDTYLFCGSVDLACPKEQ